MRVGNASIARKCFHRQENSSLSPPLPFESPYLPHLLPFHNTFFFLLSSGALHPGIPAPVLHRMVALLGLMEQAGGPGGTFAQQGGPWEFNLRDLLRWCMLAEDAALQQGLGKREEASGTREEGGAVEEAEEEEKTGSGRKQKGRKQAKRGRKQQQEEEEQQQEAMEVDAGSAASAAGAPAAAASASAAGAAVIDAAVPPAAAVEAAVLHFCRMLFLHRFRTHPDRCHLAALVSRAWGGPAAVEAAGTWEDGPSVLVTAEALVVGRARLPRATLPPPAMQAALAAAENVSACL